MFQIQTQHPHASTEINGIKFVDEDGIKKSEPVDEDTAAYFGSIDGYSVIDLVAAEKEAKAKAAADAKAEKDKKDADAKAAADAKKFDGKKDESKPA